MNVTGAVLVSLALSTISAQAQQLVDATVPHRLLGSFQKFGTAELIADDIGDPLIKGTMDGVSYLVFFYSCTNNSACKNLTFTAAWDVEGVTQEEINEWNRTKRFGKAFLDDENDPTLQMSVNLDYGVTEKNFEDTIDWWRVMLLDYRDEVISD